MSKIPKRKSSAEPLSKKNEVQTQSHQDMLEVVWARLDTLAAHLYTTPVPTDLKAICNRAALAFDEASRAASNRGEKANASLLDNYAGAIRTLEGQPPTAPVAPVLTRKGVAVELVDPIAQREGAVAGYVDITATVLKRHHAVQTFLLPFESDDDGMMETLLDRHQVDRDEYLAGNLRACPPAWGSADGAVTDILIDIRPTAPPVGQLLRELKTLRGCAPVWPRDESGWRAHDQPAHRSVIVVSPTISPTAKDMLAHEGFQHFTIEEIQALA